MWSHSTEFEDHPHFLTFPVDGFPGAKPDATNLNIGQHVVFVVEMPYNGETG